MARGYPDFFGTSIFPIYGQTQVEVQAGTALNAGNDLTVFAIAHKGILAGGILHITNYDFALGNTIELTLDNQIIFEGIPRDLYLYFNDARGNPVRVTHWCDVTGHYAAEYLPLYNWGINFSMILHNGSPFNWSVTSRLVWYEVS